MNEAQTYRGHCHCGTVQYDVTANIEHVLECNCSMCKATGWQLTFVGGTQFNLVSGEDALVDYQFADKHLHHTFCGTCGVRSFSSGPAEDGSIMYAINTRCLDGFELGELPVNHYDGAAL